MTRLFLFLAMVIGTAPAKAADLVPPDPWEIIHTARLFGEAEVGRDAMKDPQISGTLKPDNDRSALAYRIAFYGCELARNCRTILFSADLKRADWDENAPDPALFAAWNGQKLFGRAYWNTERGAVLEHPVTMADGLPKQTLVETFDAWAVAVRDYADYLEIPAP